MSPFSSSRVDERLDNSAVSAATPFANDLCTPIKHSVRSARTHCACEQSLNAATLHTATLHNLAESTT
eukprot:2642-Heterococcus_DN1.PRE.2